MEKVTPMPEVVSDSGAELAQEFGKISVLEALAQPAQEDITPSMTWQSVWSNKEDR